ncbi:MAG TPA: hypothetical protein VLY24_16135 [Bryobacteraceae bacterium]|nr:hypothetical protein [Bryobacteraceae bacterium]
MRRHTLLLMCVLASVGALIPALAQEGHPLTGTWAGDWGRTPTERNHVTLVLNWDGKTVSGTLNPGPAAAPIADVYVDWTNWTVRIEADTKDQAGNPVHITAEGRVEDIGSYHRKITGTWRQGTVKGDFRITRD